MSVNSWGCTLIRDKYGTSRGSDLETRLFVDSFSTADRYRRIENGLTFWEIRVAFRRVLRMEDGVHIGELTVVK